MDNNKPINKLLFLSLVVTACVLWGSAFAGAKIAFQYCGPIMLSGIRFSLAGLLLIPLLIFQKAPFSSLFKHWKFMLMFGFIQTYLQYGLFFMGLNEVPGAVASIIVGAGPIFVTILAHYTIHDDRFTTSKVLSCVLGFSGVVFIAFAGNNSAIPTEKFYYGITLLLLSNFVGSGTNIIVVKNKHLAISPIALTAFANFSGGVMLFLTSLCVEPNILNNPPLEFYGAVVWLAIIPAAAFSIWYYLLGLPGVKVSELNIWKFIIPVVGALLSWLLIAGETPTWQEIVGIIIISTSIIVLQKSNR